MIRALMVAMVFAFSIADAAAEVNYCNETAAAKEWTAILDSKPNDPAVIKLAAYRFGLCELVRQGRVELNDATDIFEMERWQVIQRRQELDIHPKGWTL